MHTLNPVIFDVKKLRDVIGLPVLGTVSMTWLDRDRAARRIALGSFLLGGMFLLVAFGVVVLIRNPGGEIVRSLVG